MMMIMNCSYEIVDDETIASNLDYCRMFPPSETSPRHLQGLSLCQHLSSDCLEWSCAVAVTIAITK